MGSFKVGVPRNGGIHVAQSPVKMWPKTGNLDVMRARTGN